ncbi:MAG: tetratricopeptide repeat protein [Candidatus Kapaibacterium sp.]
MRSLTFTLLLLLGIFSCTKTDTAMKMPDLMPRAGDSTSVEFLKAQATVSHLRAEIAKHPDEMKNYIELAQVYIQEARVSGKHHDYFPIADAIIAEVLRRNPDNFEANVLKSGMLMTKHQFADAKETIDKAIAKNPYNSGAYGVLCDADVELGKYDEAVKAVDKMMSARPDLRSYARASYLRELNGDRNGAIEAMKMGADAGASGQENREWALYNLGNIFLNWGKLDTAEFIYKGILEERPNYAFAMSGLAMVESARKNYAGAIGLLVKASQTLPEHIFVEQLADLYQAMGQKPEAAQLEKKALDAFALHEKDGWDVDREYAAFCLNHNINLSEAKDRAEKQYKMRPSNIDALDTYAWALYKSGSANDAIPYMEQALRMKTINPNLHYHAGMIYAKAGNTENAARELKFALNENQYLTPLTMDEAKTTLLKLEGKTAYAK